MRAHYKLRNTLFYDKAFPPGVGIARFVTDCCKLFEILNKCL